MTFTADTALFGHTSEDTAYVVDDYPYGFRLRCKIRYWIETTKSGDRFCSQTTNPKVAGERWNKPKKSTYSDVMVMFLDEEGHVHAAGLTHFTDADKLADFLAKVGDRLSDAQLRKVAVLKATRKVMEKVSVTIHEGRMTAEEEAEQAEIRASLGQAIRHEAIKEYREGVR